LERFCISRALKGRLGGDVEWHNITHFFCNGIKHVHGYNVWDGISRAMKESVSGDVVWHDITHFFRAYVEANREDHDIDAASESEASFEDEQPTRKRQSRGQVSHPATAYMAPEPVHGSTMGMTSDVEWHDIAFLTSWLSAWHMRIGDWLRS
jgi:hypothetical protein